MQIRLICSLRLKIPHIASYYYILIIYNCINIIKKKKFNLIGYC